MSRHGLASGLLVVISAPSGGGKTTLCEQLLAKRPNTMRAVTCTTRSPRNGERDGVDYYFLNRESFEQKIKAGEFLEHATVYGNFYGVLKKEILDKLRTGKDVLLSVDVQGAESIRACADEELQRALVSVFLIPPNLETLEKRLRKRGLDEPEVIQRRLSAALEEIGHANHFHYVVTSDSVDYDYEQTRAILVAEKLRQERVTLPDYNAR
jgi:guanylate kinase